MPNKNTACVYKQKKKKKEKKSVAVYSGELTGIFFFRINLQVQFVKC